MKFGVREICDVVFKAKATQKVGNKIFYPGEPVIYFDTLKTSSLEGAATTVYAQGGRGNTRLVAWEGERTVTFTMEDALISAEGFMILSGAGLIDATAGKPVYQHMTETVDAADITVEEGQYIIKIHELPYLPTDAHGNFAYVMFKKDDEIISEPYIPEHMSEENIPSGLDENNRPYYEIIVKAHDVYDPMNKKEKEVPAEGQTNEAAATHEAGYVVATQLTAEDFDSCLVDYYVARKSDAQQIEITADKFGGNYYIEASTLFRQQNGVDMPAEFIIPNAKIQSNFTFSMASSGDPSTFTFTLDAFPDYTRFDHSKKVLAAIQIFKDPSSMDLHRHSTRHEDAHDLLSF